MKKLESMTGMETLYQCFLIKSQLINMTSDELIAEYQSVDEYCSTISIFRLMYYNWFLLMDESFMRKAIDYFSYYRHKYNCVEVANDISNVFAQCINRYNNMTPNGYKHLQMEALVDESIDHGVNPFFVKAESIKKIIGEDVHQIDAIILLDKRLLKPTFPESLMCLLKYDNFVSKKDFIVSSSILLDIYGNTILHDEASKTDAKVYKKVKSTMNEIMRV